MGNDPIKRAGLISNVVESIALIPNQIKRSVYIQESGLLLNMDERVLIAEVNRVRKRNYERKREERSREEARKEQEEARRGQEAERMGSVRAGMKRMGKWGRARWNCPHVAAIGIYL